MWALKAVVGRYDLRPRVVGDAPVHDAPEALQVVHHSSDGRFEMLPLGYEAVAGSRSKHALLHAHAAEQHLGLALSPPWRQALLEDDGDGALHVVRGVAASLTESVHPSSIQELAPRHRGECLRDES